MEIFEYLVDEQAPNFREHLGVSENNRILFSGKYGKGKTTFITQFFSNQEKYIPEKKFLPITIRPINYSISSNEDIVKYIKYDILVELVNKVGDPIESFQDFSFGDVLPSYLRKNADTVLIEILKIASKLNKKLPEIVPGLEKLYLDIKSFRDELNAQKEDKIILDFLKRIESESFSIYENDAITLLIEKALAKSELSTILIIDDVDRIDPEHIFRILNVFSAHSDSVGGKENKFGFDQIMIVCDLENIRNIFFARYGSNVDFSGYIDKFFSKNVYYFQNYDQLKRASLAILANKRIRTSFQDKTLDKILGLNDGIGFVPLISNLLDLNLLSLRSFINLHVSENEIFKSVKVDELRVAFEDVSIPFEIKILSTLIGGFNQLVSALEILKRHDVRMEGTKRYINNLVWFLMLPAHRYSTDEKTYNFSFRNKIHQVQISPDYRKVGQIKMLSSEGMPTGSYSFKNEDYYTLLISTVTMLYNIRLIE
jgi:hypothetical protein